MAARQTAPADSVLAEIQRLRRMTVGELRDRWRELYPGEEARSRNKQFLFRRLAWRVQELAYGGLSERAKSRLAELAADVPLRIRPPKGFDPTTVGSAPKRDPRLPKVGSVLVRPYRGSDVRVLVREDGFEWDGRAFDSLSAVARAITGQHWNGRLFFGLTTRRQKD